MNRGRSGIVVAFWLLFVLDAVLLTGYAFAPINGGDAAGRGMEAGFRMLIAMAVGVALVIVAVVFQVVRQRALRIVGVAALAMLAIILLFDVAG